MVSFTLKEETIAEPFHKRFNIEVNLEEERRKFQTRMVMALTQVSWPIDTWKSLAMDFSQRILVNYSTYNRPGWAWLLKSPYKTYLDMGAFFDRVDFGGFIERIDCLLVSLKNLKIDKERTKYVVNAVKKSLRLARLDLGIRFDLKKKCFYPSGAKLLDERLINEELRWLADQNYTKVYEPFEKGLRFLLESKNDPKKLSDAVTDLHEALEAFAKIVCGNDRDLSGNRDRFISALNLNPYYQKMLKEYINYANEFRHAEKQRKARPDLRYEEVEAFVYLTGLFIRLGIEKLKLPQTSTS